MDHHSGECYCASFPMTGYFFSSRIQRFAISRENWHLPWPSAVLGVMEARSHTPNHVPRAMYANALLGFDGRPESFGRHRQGCAHGLD